MKIIPFWGLFGLNALFSPIMLLMGINAFFFQIRDELLWSAFYFVGLLISAYLSRQSRWPLAYGAIGITSLTSFYTWSRIV